ncbi:MAG: NADH-quinone oxidoreductase subunit L [Coriobacteriia bacterium]|nr:NADH-quinone oxidoreductase subunit L [Coriobacteriia bacterium]
MPVLFLMVPLCGIFLLNLPKRSIAAKFASWLVGLICVLLGVLAATSQMACWKPFNEAFVLPFSDLLSVDWFSAVMLFTIAMVTTAANAVGFDGEDRKKVLARSLLLICLTGMNGIVMVRDLMSVYVFLEITAVSCFVLIAIDQKIEALGGAFKYYILSGVATFAILIANAFVFMNVGSLQFADIQAALADAAAGDGALDLKISLVLFVIGLCVKAGVAPFHGWLPDAHASAPSAVSVLLSGVVIKVAGAYLILRLANEVFVEQPAARLALMVLGAFSIAVGAFGAIAQHDMKRVLAFSSVSQMGYIVLAAGLGSTLALMGAVVHIVNHAMFKSLLFVNAAAVKEQTGTTELDELGGLTERMPMTGWTSVVGLLSAAGLPPTSGFWSKLLIIMALFMADRWVFAIIALGMSIVTLGYLLMLQRNVFFGKLHAGLEELREARKSLTITALALATLTSVVGLAFPVLFYLLSQMGYV